MSTDFPTAAVGSSQAPTATVEKSFSALNTKIQTAPSKHDLPIAENLLQRDFTPAAPNQTWTSDITYIATDEGWLYLTAVLDLFSRQVVGWSMRPRSHGSNPHRLLRNSSSGSLAHGGPGS